MRRKLKQTAAALSLLGGAYCYGEAMQHGIENFAAQYDSLESEQVNDLQESNNGEEDLTQVTAVYLLGSFTLLAGAGCFAVSLRDETLSRELTMQLQSHTQATVQVESDNLFVINRQLMNRISHYDIHVVLHLGEAVKVESNVIS